MPYVKFTGKYGAFITGRDVDSAVHYEDASNQTCVGIVPEVRAGDVEIEQSEYDSLKSTILAYNATIPAPTPPEPPIDPDGELSAAISAATTLAELKAALLGQRSEAAVKGRPNK